MVRQQKRTEQDAEQERGGLENKYKKIQKQQQITKHKRGDTAVRDSAIYKEQKQT